MTKPSLIALHYWLVAVLAVGLLSASIAVILPVDAQNTSVAVTGENVQTEILCTPSPNLNLQLQAENASFARISNNENFEGSIFEDFSSPQVKPWTVPAGDGEKQIYVQYKSADGLLGEIVTAKVKLDTSGACGYVPADADLDKVEFFVTESLPVKTVTTTQLTAGCKFVFALKNSDGNLRRASSAQRISVNDSAAIYTFNHPTENRSELVVQQTLNKCRAEYKILYAGLPADSYALLVTPTVGSKNYEDVVVWSNVLTGAIEVQNMVVAPAVSENTTIIPEIKPPSKPVPINKPTEALDNDTSSTVTESTEVECRNETQQQLLVDLQNVASIIQLLSSTVVTGQNTEKAMFLEMKKNAEKMVEVRLVRQSLEQQVVAAQNKERRLHAELAIAKRSLDLERNNLQQAQAKLASVTNVRTINDKDPLSNVDSGITVSFDGGETWVVMDGESGVESFLNQVREQHAAAKEVHRAGQLVKKYSEAVIKLDGDLNSISSTLLEVSNKYRDNLANEQSLQSALKKLSMERINILEDIVNNNTELGVQEAIMRDKQLQIDNCSSEVKEVSKWLDWRQLIIGLFSPILPSYART